jgi:hypothetical protein
MTPTRRDLFHTLPAVGLIVGTAATASAADEPAAKKSTLWPGFPKQEAKLAQEIVGVSHFKLERVKELITAHPQLVNAWWDWGFGDWESPLGAASHVGDRPIAEYLLEKGARIDIFAAAMLGHTDVVKAFVKAQPGIQKSWGPHGLTLLSHAKQGGKKAADTLAYLESLGDAGIGPKTVPLPAERKNAFLGKFESKEADVRIESKLNKAGTAVILDMKIGPTDTANKTLSYAGDDEFFPSGVPTVRIKYAVENGKTTSITIKGAEVILVAKRVS